jgi:DNA-directed RNA polymerase subunit RPC12/RpoP
MGFDIRRFIIEKNIPIEKESPSQITIRCPLCNSKIQIKKATGAYFCVGGCSTENIRKAWGFYAYSSFIPPTRLPITPLSVDFSSNILTRINKYYPSKTIEIENGRKIYYEYSENKRAVRKEVRGFKKIILPEVKVNEKWVGIEKQKEIKITDFPFYGEKYLQKEKNKILMVEGEKCVDIIAEKWGVVALSPIGGGWSEKGIEKNLARLFYKIDSIIYLADNDEAGRKKEKLVLKSAWYQGIPCSNYPLDKYFKYEGEDIGDLLLENENHPIKNELK